MSVGRRNNTNSINESNLTFNLKISYIIRKKLLLSCLKSAKSLNPRVYILYPLADAGLGWTRPRWGRQLAANPACPHLPSLNSVARLPSTGCYEQPWWVLYVTKSFFDTINLCEDMCQTNINPSTWYSGGAITEDSYPNLVYTTLNTDRGQQAGPGGGGGPHFHSPRQTFRIKVSEGEWY